MNSKSIAAGVCDMKLVGEMWDVGSGFICEGNVSQMKPKPTSRLS